MLYVTLKEVQETLPDYQVYAFKMKYNAELETYHIELWTNHPVGLHDKYEFSFDVHLALAKSTVHLLDSIRDGADRIIAFHRENTWKKLV